MVSSQDGYALLARVRRVLASCRTLEQRQVARRYLALAWGRLPNSARWGFLGELEELAASGEGMALLMRGLKWKGKA